MTQTDIPGYTYGTQAVPRSPVSLQELEQLQATLLLGEDDLAALRRSGEVLAPQVEDILDVWYGFVGANPHLLAAFSNAQGQPDQDYLAAVRRRFGRWILDTARATYDQAWLDYQHEIGVRHTRRGKNRTDGAKAADHIPCATCSPCGHPPRGCHPWPTATSAARVRAATPATTATASPWRPIFSYAISAVRAAIQRRSATPAANITSISAQQQPRRHRPWPQPSRRAAPGPRR